MSSVSTARSATNTRGRGRGASNPRTPTPVHTRATTRSNARIVEVDPTLVPIPESDPDPLEGGDGDHDPAAPGGGPPGGSPPDGGPPDGDPEEADMQDPYGLAAAISAGLAQGLSNALRPQAPRPKPKAREPDAFDGSDPRKLNNFLAQCLMYFANYEDSYTTDTQMINFALSYLKGSALDWFEPWILNPELEDEYPAWWGDWSGFVEELSKNFGPVDPIGDAEEDLENLQMKDGQKIITYNVAFSRIASKLHFPDNVLRRAYYKGLCPRIKDELSHITAPKKYLLLRDAAQSIDGRYWQRYREKQREEAKTKAKAKPGGSTQSNNNNSASSAKPNNQSSASSAGNNRSSNSGKSSNNASSSSSSTPSHLGKDGKLTPAERKRRLDNKLCLFCAAPGHMAKDCTKPSSSAAKGRAASASSAPKDAGSKQDSKK